MQNELWIAQISDTHIMPKGENWLDVQEAKTHERLIDVIADINTLEPKPDIVIHSGDMTESGDIESYTHAKELLDKLTIPYFLICGNHDDLDNMREIFPNHNYFIDDEFSHYVIDHLPLRIISLDSRVIGKSYGMLCARRLNWLKETLNQSEKDTIIFIHHYPITVQGDLANKFNLNNNDELEEVITKFPNIKGIYCGHYHYAAAGIFAGKLCWISPSAAPTHIVENDKCTGLNLSPASYSLHHYKDGKINSRVINITEKAAKP